MAITVAAHPPGLDQSIPGAVPSHIALLDRQGLILDVNEAWRQFASANGYADERGGVGRSYLAVCDADGVDAGREAARGIRNVLAGGSPLFHLEYECHGPNERRWFAMSVTPFATAGPVRAVVEHRDTTAQKVAAAMRKRSDGQLWRSRERLTLAQKAARIGFFEWNVQSDETAWTDEVAALYGMTADGIGPGYDGWARLVHADDRGSVERDLRRAFDDGEFWSEWRVVLPDGSLRWLQGQAKLFRDQNGRPLRLLGVKMDVTERRRAAEDLRASEQRLELAVAAAHLGTWHLNLSTRELGCSAVCKANLGLPPHAHVDFRIFVAAIHPDDRDAVLASIDAAVRDRREYRDEYRVVWPDGSVHWISARGRASYGVAGGPLAMHGVTVDFTDRILMEESLRRQAVALADADRRKDEFLAVLGHELRNPLSPIRNAVQLLRLQGGTDPIVQRANDVIGRQAAHMTRLLDDLLEMSRITLGKVRLRREPVEVATIVGQALETVRPLVEARGHRLDVSVDDLCVNGDPARLAQVVANLLDNAARYTEPGGHIGVVARRVESDVVIRVSDDGRGIPPETLPRIFDLFAQAESSLDRTHGGLGIGLTLVRRLVEMHGGAVEVESAGRGGGSTFSVRLPGVARPTAVRESCPAEVPTGLGAGRRVLVVDDNVDSAESLAMLLSLGHHSVRVAHDGLAALTAVRDFHPAVVILDIGLPRLDGLQVAARIREDRDLDGVQLIAMTGYGQEEDRRRSAAAGFDLHLVKPIDVAALADILGARAAQRVP